MRGTAEGHCGTPAHPSMLKGQEMFLVMWGLRWEFAQEPPCSKGIVKSRCSFTVFSVFFPDLLLLESQVLSKNYLQPQPEPKG